MPATQSLPPLPPPPSAVFISTFHPSINAAYVVNELSSTVSVYEFNAVEARGLRAGGSQPTLRFVQSVSTIPSAYPRKLNTCGRICVDPTGRQVVLRHVPVVARITFFFSLGFSSIPSRVVNGNRGKWEGGEAKEEQARAWTKAKNFCAVSLI